jgi:hypothetical protein
MIKYALTVAAACGALPALAAPNVVVDGSFEGAGPVADTYGTFTGTDLPGWRVIGTGKSMSLQFTAQETDDSFVNSLDDASVIIVPEPGATGMLAAGLLGLLGLGVRRYRGR